MSTEIKQQIEDSVANSPVHVFMKGTPEWPQCGFSKATCDALRSIDVPFTATNVLEDLDNYRATLMEVTAWPTIPQVFIGGEFVGGCDIVLEMLRNGELQEKVGALQS
jgi:monothiol glutaredoxin